MVAVATGPNVLHLKQWTELKFIWNPIVRNLTIFVDGSAEGQKSADIQSSNKALGSHKGLWTWGKQEGSSTAGNLEADVRDFYFCRSADISDNRTKAEPKIPGIIYPLFIFIIVIKL